MNRLSRRQKSLPLIVLGIIQLVASLSVCSHVVYVARTIESSDYAIASLVSGLVYHLASIFTIFGGLDIYERQFSIITAMMLASVGSVTAIFGMTEIISDWDYRKIVCRVCTSDMVSDCNLCSNDYAVSHAGLLSLTLLILVLGLILIICTYCYTCLNLPALRKPSQQNVGLIKSASAEDSEVAQDLEVALEKY